MPLREAKQRLIGKNRGRYHFCHLLSMGAHSTALAAPRAAAR
jgi:hypothetical protein